MYIQQNITRGNKGKRQPKNTEQEVRKKKGEQHLVNNDFHNNRIDDEDLKANWLGIGEPLRKIRTTAVQGGCGHSVITWLPSNYFVRCFRLQHRTRVVSRYAIAGLPASYHRAPCAWSCIIRVCDGFITGTARASTRIYAKAVLGVVILSICPFVCLSVTRVDCDKSKQCAADIFIAHERAITLLFRHQHWLLATPLPSKICAQSDPPPSKRTDFDGFSLIRSQP